MTTGVREGGDTISRTADMKTHLFALAEYLLERAREEPRQRAVGSGAQPLAW